MSTKLKIIASIWVPIVTMYILITISGYFSSELGSGSLKDNFLLVFELFIIGAIVWLPLLIFCLIIEILWIKKEVVKARVAEIFIIEIIMVSIPIWFVMVMTPEAIDDFIVFNLIIILSIAARWGYLKWRKIC